MLREHFVHIKIIFVYGVKTHIMSDFSSKGDINDLLDKTGIYYILAYFHDICRLCRYLKSAKFP